VVANQLKKVSLAGGAPIVIADTVNRASWGDDGDIVLERGFTSRAAGLWRVSAAGGPLVNITTLDTTRRESAHTWPSVLPGSGAAVSANGTLVFVEGDNRRQMVLVDRAGTARPLLPALDRYDFPRFSPSGDRVALAIAEQGGTRKDIWVFSLSQRTMTRLTRDG